MTRHFASLSIGFAALAVVSVALKDRVPGARGGVSPRLIAARLANTMRRQGFSVGIQPVRDQSLIIVGARGNCRIGARDASDGPAMHDIFKQQTAGIGALHYVYRGTRYDELPRVRLYADRIVSRTLDRFDIHLDRSIPVALAQSAGCARDPLDLSDFSLTS